MKTKKLQKRILSAVICVVMCLSMTFSMIACGGSGNSRPDALVIMTEELDGLFNPFYSTTANDATIISDIKAIAKFLIFALIILYSSIMIYKLWRVGVARTRIQLYDIF